MHTTITPKPHREVLFLQRGLIASLIAAAVFFSLGVLFSLFFELAYTDRIYPGVRAGGIDVGGENSSQAVSIIAEGISYPRNGQVLLYSDSGGQWLFTPDQLGLYLDPEATAKAALAPGREGPIAQRLSEQLSAAYAGYEIAPRFIFEKQAAKLQLETIASQVDVPIIEPSITINGTDIAINSGQDGKVVNIEATLALIKAQLGQLQDGAVPLVFEIVKPEIVDVSAQAEIARAIVSEPLTLVTAGGSDDNKGPWTIDQSTLAQMLSFEYVTTDQAMEYALTLKSDEMVRFLATIAPELQRYPQNAKFIFNDDTHLLDLKEASVTGRTLNVNRTLETIHQQLLAGEHQIELQFDIAPPAVADDATGESLGITELVHTQYSYFYGSAISRVQNISAAASRFHGILVAPGETFSMSDTLGDISLDNGYAEALIILGGRTIQGVGGGVCQVSTTLFRAAFFAGYPIVERYPHAYRVSYYEKIAGNALDVSLAGLDATVFVPLIDFRFTNDTPYWLLMETYIHPEASRIMWKFYSTSDGRTVDWTTTGPINIKEAPEPAYNENPEFAQGVVKQVDWSADGAEVTVERKVYRGGALYFQDRFYTQYQPWQAVYEYGPGTEGMPPEKSTDE